MTAKLPLLKVRRVTSNTSRASIENVAPCGGIVAISGGFDAPTDLFLQFIDESERETSLGINDAGPESNVARCFEKTSRGGHDYRQRP